MVKLGARPVGMAEAVLGEIDLLRPQRGRGRGGLQVRQGFSFSPRAGQFWRFALGSNAAVLKRIGKGGTANAKELSGQLSYLFSKSTAIFGNAVTHDPNASGLAPEERREIVETWVDGWRGTPKNGHTSHLLMSFPAHVRPEKAQLIAEAWAFEMFQSGEHQDDEWAYVAALHTDRPHPHVHIVPNNRGLANDSWFYMARNHVFNLAMMKERMVAIAAEEGVCLDATSRAERGILTYGPNRAEIERARREGRAPEERMREGRALEDALATFARSAEVMRGLLYVAALTELPEISPRITEAQAVLRRGGVIRPFPVLEADAERADLERHFNGWMAATEQKIRQMSAAERKTLREELHGYAEDIARALGDARGAELLRQRPQSEIYGIALEEENLRRGGEMVRLRPGAAGELRDGILAAASGAGLNPETIARRLETGAANAWEERDWIRTDLFVIAGRWRLDLRDPEQAGKVSGQLDGFYAKAEALIDHAREQERLESNDRLVRTLHAIAGIMETEGRIEFRGDAHAERFAEELRRRYGAGIMAELAGGRTEALAADVSDPERRRWIARAVVSAAKSYVTVGLTLRETENAERRLMDRQEHDRALDRE
ncbi:relaxase/mobilization nuclease domain-containing protein [Rhodobacter sp. SGA-6-6]|uniref:relaxase/mobilization nuclease domain-containing protein n=1 Tax=Rhodobacter sp. SGA-6-6 TaxID=2710882 RepID=UPI0013EBC0FD|nr:relaxase/mobilization nuclease domain-containing protein [Rhodobacter sp. SGA-6-6]NGM44588.1 relaxase/mobilization nuclease domain-containing protein [Rhodobacter sp. SGA-6-6]